MNAPDGGWLSAALLPASWAYRGAVGLRNLAYDRGLGVRRCPIPVVSIGNLTVGGTGKTPLVDVVTGLLASLGAKPAVVSRGYGGRAGRGPVRVGDAAAARLGPEFTGDEPWMLASLRPEVPVVVGSNRLAGVRIAASDGATVAVLDDGFQHRRVARDLDIVVLRSPRPFGNGRLLPAGPLREPESSLRRADLAVLVGDSDDALADERILRSDLAPRFGVVRAVRRPAGVFDTEGREIPPPRRAVAFCGIGDPESFRRTLVAIGVQVTAWSPFPDHHPFSDSDLRSLAAIANREGATLLTTEKDLARLGERARSHDDLRGTLAAVRIRLALSDETRLLRALGETVAPGAGR